MKKKLFIVQPVYDGDILWRVCSTTSRKAFLEAYWADEYEEEKDFTNKMDAVKYCKSIGCVRTKII